MRKGNTTMWQHVLDTLTPSQEELRQAERELVHVQQPPQPAIQRGAARSNMRLLAAAALLLSTFSLAWVGSAIVFQDSILEQTNFDQAIRGLNADEENETWRQSLIRVRRDVHMALRIIHHLQESPDVDTSIRTLAAMTLQRLRTNTTPAGSQGRISDLATAQDLSGACDQATQTDTPANEKLHILRELELLAYSGIKALRGCNVPQPTSLTSTLRMLDQWLSTYADQPPTTPESKQQAKTWQ